LNPRSNHASLKLPMSEPIDILALYLHLATASEQRRRPHVRDRLLVIAATIAARCNLTRIADHCKSKILEHNPHHLIGRWESVEVALEDSDFLHLLRSVQRQYPQEKAERLLETLGVERGSERDAYYSDEEFAASLLGVSLGELDNLYGSENGTGTGRP
jgi:hypothetical protein